MTFRSMGLVVTVMLITYFCSSSGETGTVKWFNADKGFGFISPDDGGKDVFMHFGDIVSEDFKTVNEGDHVTYEVEKTPKGEKAAKITVVQ